MGFGGFGGGRGKGGGKGSPGGKGKGKGGGFNEGPPESVTEVRGAASARHWSLSNHPPLCVNPLAP